METEQFSLCWNNFHNNLRNGFHSLLLDEDLVDVTLAAEGRYLKAHKAVLSICSPYFKELFKANPCKHPIVILQDVKYSSLNCLLQFMYQGEVSVSQEEIPTFMKVAETLKIKGLTEHTAPVDDKNGISDNSVCGGSPYPYENLDQRQLRRTRPAKKLIRPLQPLRTLDGSKTVKSPQSLTPPPSVSSPHLPPAKKPCTENIKERVSHYADHSVTPKEEPIDHSSVDDYKDSYRDDTFSEHSQSSSTWVPDIKVPPDVSSPGTLQCVLGKRGNPRLILDGYVFFKKSTYKGKSFWYCKYSRSPHKCQAVCWTLNGEIVKWPAGHSHDVIPEPFNPEEDVEVPIDKLQYVLRQSAFTSEIKWPAPKS